MVMVVLIRIRDRRPHPGNDTALGARAGDLQRFRPWHSVVAKGHVPDTASWLIRDGPRELWGPDTADPILAGSAKAAAPSPYPAGPCKTLFDTYHPRIAETNPIPDMNVARYEVAGTW
jgi:hypothetical protein